MAICTFPQIAILSSETTMRVRTSGTILAAPQPDGWILYNFLSKTAAQCSWEAFSLMRRLTDWSEFEDAAMSGGEHSSYRLRIVLSELLENNLVVSEGSVAAEREREFHEKWKWGLAAAALHFSTLNTPFMSLEDSTAEQLARLQYHKPPASYFTNSAGALSMPPPGASSPGLFSTMLRRRTNRSAAPRSITLQQLADCLFSGFAVTGQVETAAGKLPLSIAPSGGARNPYEAYVYAQAVEGLEPGFYHYSGLEHSLDLVKPGLVNQPELMLGGQEWA